MKRMVNFTNGRTFSRFIAPLSHKISGQIMKNLLTNDKISYTTREKNFVINYLGSEKKV